MEIDTSEMDPVMRQQVEGIASVFSVMPSEAIRFLRQLCAQELVERDEPLD